MGQPSPVQSLSPSWRRTAGSGGDSGPGTGALVGAWPEGATATAASIATTVSASVKSAVTARAGASRWRMAIPPFRPGTKQVRSGRHEILVFSGLPIRSSGG